MDAEATLDAEHPVVPLLEPRDGVPDPVTTRAALADIVSRYAAGTGPVAVDAERASGYRYSQRAYLVQLRRAGAGTALVDPISLPDLSALGVALANAEWVLHAASQDLPCLAEVGLRPGSLFDTELAGRLLGYARVGLGSMVEEVLGLRLEKGHSAADWSTRPLPQPWLNYAALDVEVLLDLRDALERELVEAGKLDWARQEFAAVLAAPPPTPRTDPWRRTSGMHKIRNRRQMAAIRALWQSRDDLAQLRDLAPGRILPDSAIVAAVLADPKSAAELQTLPVFGGRHHRRLASRWYAALHQARGLPDSALPQHTVPSDGPPPISRWAERDPMAAARLASARAGLGELAERVRMPVENLLTPEVVRRLAWTPPPDTSPAAIRAVLRGHGARPWQIELTAELLSAALRVR
ncbi:MAG TPA: ribonuclease D [Mycobacteriales bacterium]|nr:ribonuclease D [Mycobacteriales bacterium]